MLLLVLKEKMLENLTSENILSPNDKPTKRTLGVHLIIDFHECDLKDFCINKRDILNITNLVKKKLEDTKIIVLETHSHFFSQNAISISFHLAESHLHFHTWPEKRYVSFDFFCCTQLENLEKQMIEISNCCDNMFFKSKKKTQHIIPRGIL